MKTSNNNVITQLPLDVAEIADSGVSKSRFDFHIPSSIGRRA
jgi:hypothetical protein